MLIYCDQVYKQIAFSTERRIYVFLLSLSPPSTFPSPSLIPSHSALLSLLSLSVPPLSLPNPLLSPFIPPLRYSSSLSFKFSPTPSFCSNYYTVTRLPFNVSFLASLILRNVFTSPCEVGSKKYIIPSHNLKHFFPK